MQKTYTFINRNDFRTWLQENHLSPDGIWLIFGKAGGPKTLKATEALEEALCYGWIDGQLQSIDDFSYKKYFSARRQNSKWSKKNKEIVEKLEKQGLMSEFGRKKIEEAKQNGQGDAPEALVITQEHIDELLPLLQEFEPAYTNFQAMSFSVKKTYTRAYLNAKTDEGRKKRLIWMIERLHKNLKPM